MRVLEALAIFAVLCLTLHTSYSQDKDQKKKKAPKPHPSLAPIEDEPGLPRVLLIGDSISMGYTIPTRELLKGKANIHRIPVNGGPTTRGVEEIDKWLGDKKWDVIHFNWGLHDLKSMDDGKLQVPLADYEKNLTQLVERLKKTGAKLIWCATTPVPEGEMKPKRLNSDVIAYNEAAKKIMDANGIAIDDLYAFALPKLKETQMPVNVHFTPDGSNVLAKQVADCILKALGKEPLKQ
ncbi:MAG: SGNH/GDSL hydrolase family protein [Planctomycetota bacterium]